MTLLDFFESANYIDAVKLIKEKTNISIYPIYNDIMLDMDMKMLIKSEIPLEELAQTLEKDLVKIVSFSIEKILQLDEDDEQEYSSNEEPDLEEGDDNEIDQGFSKSFLMINLIEYYLLDKDNKKLEAYLKAIRIPKMKVYIGELKSIFAKIDGTS